MSDLNLFNRDSMNPKNPIPEALMDPAWRKEPIPPEVLVAFDAWESGDPRAMSLLVGLPATIGIGSDWYAAKVVKVTAKTIHVAYEPFTDLHGVKGAKIFRFTKRGWRSGSYRLTVGHAETHLDPSF